MVTVTVSIKGTPVFTRSAMRIRQKSDSTETYLVDTGKQIHIKEGEGAVALAHKMLNTIEEPRKKEEPPDTRTYYKSREEAEENKQPGDRIYHSSERGYWVTTPHRRRSRT